MAARGNTAYVRTSIADHDERLVDPSASPRAFVGWSNKAPVSPAVTMGRADRE